jgi:hypothetical protein
MDRTPLSDGLLREREVLLAKVDALLHVLTDLSPGMGRATIVQRPAPLIEGRLLRLQLGLSRFVVDSELLSGRVHLRLKALTQGRRLPVHLAAILAVLID